MLGRWCYDNVTSLLVCNFKETKIFLKKGECADFKDSASRKRCWKEEYSTFKEFQTAVKDYIDYYNNKRIQEKTKWMSPVQYRETSMRSA